MKKKPNESPMEEGAFPRVVAEFSDDNYEVTRFFRVVLTGPGHEVTRVEQKMRDAMGHDSWQATSLRDPNTAFVVLDTLARWLDKAQITVDHLANNYAQCVVNLEELDKRLEKRSQQPLELIDAIPDIPTARDIYDDLGALRKELIDVENNENAFYDAWPALDALRDRLRGAL